MKVLIRFMDNDFGKVLRAFGDLMIEGPTDYTDEWLTKANIVRWFNATAPTLYEMIQAKDHFTARNDARDAVLDKYLSIDESKVFLGEEVDRKMDTYHQWGNYDSVLIELGEPRRAYPKRHATLV